MTETIHIVVAMKPLDGNFAQNALEHGVAGLNIDASRIEYASDDDKRKNEYRPSSPGSDDMRDLPLVRRWGEWKGGNGRFPANVILEDVESVLREFQDVGRSGTHGGAVGGFGAANLYGDGDRGFDASGGYADSGSSARFFKRIQEK